MKIKMQLPQFDKKTALLIVTGKHTGKYYFADSGEIKKVHGFTIPVSRYSDREGFFQRSRGGSLIASGSVYESDKEYIITQLIAKLREGLKEADEKYQPDEIYLFSPEYLLSRIRAKMENRHQEKIRYCFPGNYDKFHAFELIGMIQDEIEKSAGESVPISIEARKLENMPRAIR